jgi:YVTN family beta-propeller protein/VCBS repeat-containing protein
MGSSRYVGRVGALAVALGVGCAVASPAGIAWAETAESSSDASDTAATSASDTRSSTAEPSTDTATPDSDAGGAAETGTDTESVDSGPSSPSAETDEVAPGVTISSSGGAKSSDDDENDDTGASKSTIRDRSDDSTDAEERTPRRTARSEKPAVAVIEGDTTATVTASAPPAAAETPPVITTTFAPTRVTIVLSDVVAPMLSQLLAAIPGGPVESPLGWILLGAARRQFGDIEAPAEATSAMTAEPALLMTVAATDQPPTAGVVQGTPATATGAVTGQIVGTDPEGAALTYTVTTPPSTGALVFNGVTGQFTYTPTTLQRVNAGITTVNDTIAMTVTVSDGVNKVATVVNIPVSPAPVTKTGEIGAINDAHAMVVAGTRAYVTNKTAGTVTVIDTTTNTVIGTIAVGARPDGLAIKPDGKTLYVSSLDSNTIKVVNTATNTVTATIAVAKPSAMAMSSSGTTLYITSRDAGTMIKINTSTNTIAGTVTLPAGSRPTDIVVSPDKTKIYVISTKTTGGGSVAVIGSTSTVSTLVTDLASVPTGLAISPDNRRLYVSTADGKLNVIDTTTKAVVASYTVGGVPAGVTVTNDGSLVAVTDTRGRVSALDAATGAIRKTVATRTSTTAMTIAPSTVASADGTKLYVTDYDADKVHIIALAPANTPPRAGTPTSGTPLATTGAVTGTLGATDSDGDVLGYTVTQNPSKGTVSVRTDGTFTYTPTAAARHDAAEVGAPVTATTDKFTVSVTDGRGGIVTATVTVPISPTNKIPVVTKIVGTPNTTTGIVTGSVTATDGDWDVRTYTTTTQPTKGSVVVTSAGAFTYTPTAEDRHAAAKLNAAASAKSDTFTITVDDGHGGVVPVSVTVTISPANATPTAPALTTSATNTTTGVVTGIVKATDTDSDTLTYTSTAGTKGVLTMQSNGSFTYTPTLAARQAAAQPGATITTKTETVTVTVADGYGGTTSATLTLNIAPYTSGNVAPTNPRSTVNIPTSAIGQVTGTVTADDANGDDLTYTLSSAPTKGLVKVDAATGAFTYVPDVDARYDAKATTGVDTDTFTVTITDGNGGSVTATVGVEVAPPAASSIDQRATTVAIAAPDMYFYTQAELDQAFGKLQASGINTVRVLMPWAGIEPTNDGWRWTEADRLVTTANAHGIEILAVLNSTPGWAAATGTPALSGRPASPQEFAEFAGAVATRYAGKIAAYEVWNEPNGQVFWAPAPNAAQYTEILKAAYPAIKTADPAAIVVAAGLGAVVDYGSYTTNPVRFVEEMYAAGAAGYFDAMAFHPYLYTKTFTGTMATNPDSAANQLNRIHQLMVANGDGNKKIWVTEYGQPSAYAGDTVQAAYLADFLRAWRDLDYAGPAFIHTLRDYPNSDPNQASFGLFRQDWSPKPVWYTVQDIIAENQDLIT